MLNPSIFRPPRRSVAFAHRTLEVMSPKDTLEGAGNVVTVRGVIEAIFSTWH
jgi:hypothetical protein